MLENSISIFNHDGGVHILDAVNSISNCHGKPNFSKNITLDDVMCLIESIDERAGADFDDYVRKHNVNMLELKVKRVNHNIDVLRENWPEATPLELFVAFDEANYDVEELALRFLDRGYKDMIRGIIKKKLSHNQKDKDEEEAPTGKLIDNNDEDADVADDPADDFEYIASTVVEISNKAPKQRHSKANPATVGKIPPAPKGIDEATWQSWSDARRSSYLRADSYPNAYYYRHLPPGEKQKNGGWTNAEKQQFLQRVKEFRGNSTTMSGDWGMFSLAIPGRVGYQCSNFYRKLVESGEIYDSAYVKGEGGKLHHISRIHDGKVTSKAAIKAKKSTPSHQPRIVEPHRIKSLTLTLSKKEHECEESLSRYDTWAMQNPLPNVVDAITQEPIRVPAISPDGYVLDYNTWLMILKTNKENPFTRQPVSKRQLVVLTCENIAQYEPLIVNLNNNVE